MSLTDSEHSKVIYFYEAVMCAPAKIDGLIAMALGHDESYSEKYKSIILSFKGLNKGSLLNHCKAIKLQLL